MKPSLIIFASSLALLASGPAFGSDWGYDDPNPAPVKPLQAVAQPFEKAGAASSKAAGAGRSKAAAAVSPARTGNASGSAASPFHRSATTPTVSPHATAVSAKAPS